MHTLGALGSWQGTCLLLRLLCCPPHPSHGKPPLPRPAARAVFGPQGAVHRHCGQWHRDVPAHVRRPRLHAGLGPAHPVQLLCPGGRGGAPSRLQRIVWGRGFEKLLAHTPCCTNCLPRGLCSYDCPPTPPAHPLTPAPCFPPHPPWQNVTWEGENSVMYLQTARYLIKSALAVQAGKPLTGSAAYLATAAQQVRRAEGGREGGRSKGRSRAALLGPPSQVADIIVPT